MSQSSNLVIFICILPIFGAPTKEISSESEKNLTPVTLTIKTPNATLIITDAFAQPAEPRLSRSAALFQPVFEIEEKEREREESQKTDRELEVERERIEEKRDAVEENAKAEREYQARQEEENSKSQYHVNLQKFTNEYFL